MNFQKLFARIREIDQGKKNLTESTQLKECGMVDSMPGIQQSPVTPPMTMNVNVNANGVDQIKELMKLMNASQSTQLSAPMAMPTPGMPIGAPASEPIKPPMAPVIGMPDVKEPGMADLIKIASEPMDHEEPDADNFGGPSDNDADNMTAAQGDVDGDGDHDMDDHKAEKHEMQGVADEVRNMADTLADENSDGGFGSATTKPDEKVSGIGAVTATGDDLASKGGEAPKKNGGGNPFSTESIRAQLDARYQEIKEAKKAKPDYIDADGDGDKKEPMSKAFADKKKNPFASKEESVQEGWDDMVKAGKDVAASKGTGKFDSKKTSTGTVYTRKSSTFSDGGDDSDTKKAKAKAKK